MQFRQCVIYYFAENAKVYGKENFPYMVKISHHCHNICIEFFFRHHCFVLIDEKMYSYVFQYFVFLNCIFVFLYLHHCFVFNIDEKVAATYSARLWHSQTDGKVVVTFKQLPWQFVFAEMLLAKKGGITNSWALANSVFKVRVVLTVVTDKHRGHDDEFDEYITSMVKPSKSKNKKNYGLNVLLRAISFFRSIEEIPGTEVVLEKNIISDCVLQAQVKP